MSRFFKKAIASNWFMIFIYRFIRLYSLTFRMTIENEQEWMSYLKNRGRVLLCVWHQQFFSAIRYFQKFQEYKPALMISKSADGDLIAGVASRTGWRPARGSSSKGGKTAMKEVVSHLKATRLAAHIVDGPRGPIGKVKAGVISIALEAGAVIVPFYVSVDRAWYFNSWDRFCVPKPFAKVTLKYDNMIEIHKPEPEKNFEAMRQEVEDIMTPELKVV